MVHQGRRVPCGVCRCKTAAKGQSLRQITKVEGAFLCQDAMSADVGDMCKLNEIPSISKNPRKNEIPSISKNPRKHCKLATVRISGATVRQQKNTSPSPKFVKPTHWLQAAPLLDGVNVHRPSIGAATDGSSLPSLQRHVSQTLLAASLAVQCLNIVIKLQCGFKKKCRTED